MEEGAKQYEIAVIVTVFNKEKFLKDTLESILTQKTSRPFCIILSDDGSTDSSRQICADYAAKYHPASNDDYVCVFDITDREHRGVNGNFLHCLKFAIGLNVKYISQIDSDDILADPAFLDRQVSFLESHPDAQAAASGFFLISEDDDLSSSRRLFDNHNKSKIEKASYKPILENFPDKSHRTLHRSTQYLLSVNNPLVAGGVTYKSDYIGKYLEEFASPEDSTQDLPLWLYISQFGRFFSCRVKSLAYRNLSESVSRSLNLEAQLRFQQSSHDTRQRFNDCLRNIGYLKKNTPFFLEETRPAWYSNYFFYQYMKCLGKLKEKTRRLYEQKMLRLYAKLSPREYPAQLKQSLKKSPSLIFSKDTWRSIGVYLKNR